MKSLIKNFIQYKAKTGKDIVITYSATLNEKAELGATPNTNDVQLTYSNDPNYNYDGEHNPDEPGSGAPVGETPKSTVYTFTTEIELTKVDENGAPLAGAKFQISGETVNVVMVNSEIYVPIDGEPEAGVTVYYMLKNGSYTDVAPTELTADDYDSTTQKYKKITVVTEETQTEAIVKEGYVDGTGKLTFTGLAAGTYTITELVAPDGYNKLNEGIELTITADMTTTPGSCTWTVNTPAAVNSDGVITIDVENKQGSTLPTTGGIGTTIFYVVGGLLVVVAGVLLIARKRANCEK